MPERDRSAEPDPSVDQHLAQTLPALRRYVRRQVAGDVHAADDIVQEALLRAWRHRERWHDGAVPRAWLFTVARHLVVDRHRRAAARPAEVDVDVSRRPDLRSVDDLEAVLARRALVPALRRLSPVHLQTVLYRHYRGLTEVEVARQLDVPLGTVKSRVHYALRELRLALLEAEAPAPPVRRPLTTREVPHDSAA